MRIICKRPMDKAPHTLGVCAYDIIGFRHHPMDTNPILACTLASGGNMLILTWPGKDTDGVLDRIMELLLSPGGTADCRKLTQLKVEMRKLPVPHVILDNTWAQSVVVMDGGDGTHECLATVTIR